MTIKIKNGKRRKEWPKEITAGSARVKIYRVKHASSAEGFRYEVVWTTPAGRRKDTFANKDVAIAEAQTKASQLAHGRMEGAEMSQGDRDELQAARELAKARGKPLLTALQEWAKAHDFAGQHLIEATQVWAQKHAAQGVKRILVKDAVSAFIAAKTKAGKEGDVVYSKRLKCASCACSAIGLTPCLWRLAISRKCVRIASFCGRKTSGEAIKLTTISSWAASGSSNSSTFISNAPTPERSLQVVDPCATRLL